MTPPPPLTPDQNVALAERLRAVETELKAIAKVIGPAFGGAIVDHVMRAQRSLMKMRVKLLARTGVRAFEPLVGYGQK